MGWLEEVLSAIQRDTPPTDMRQDSFDSARRNDRFMARPSFMPFPDGGDPLTAGGVMPGGPGLPQPYPMAGDPMTAGGTFRTQGSPQAPADMAAAQAGNRILASNPAFGFPTSQPMEKYTDYASGYPIEMERPKAQFGDIPPGPPPAPPQMAAQAPVPGLNSPIGGGGAPFGPSPSMVQAQAMTAPPPPPAMAPQAPVPGLVPPGAAPGIPAPPGPPPPAPAPAPVVAEGGDEGGSTDVGARRRAGPVAAAAAGVPAEAPVAPMGMVPAAAQKPFLERLAALGPGMVAIGDILAGQGSGASQRLTENQQKLDLQTQQGNATARLLASRGASMPEIQAAVSGGPDAIKALLGEYLGKDKWKIVQTGEDARGRKTFMQENQTTGAVRPLPGNAGDSGGADTASDAAAAAGITGDEFLKTVPNAQDRSIVKQLAQYDLDPAKVSAKGGNRERLLALAEQYDPDYKAVLYAPRAAALKEFLSGGPNAPASIITNGNTAIQHLGRMSELSAKLGGVNKAWILNGLINWANVTAEDMKNNPDLARYKGAEDRFVEEATKFYRGVGGNKADIERALNILKAGQSPEARQAAIQEQAELMQSKINALQDRYKSAMGPSGWKKALHDAGSEFPIVQQKSAEELEKIRKRASGENVAGATKAPKPGNYVYRNGALVPE